MKQNRDSEVQCLVTGERVIGGMVGVARLTMSVRASMLLPINTRASRDCACGASVNSPVCASLNSQPRSAMPPETTQPHTVNTGNYCMDATV